MERYPKTYKEVKADQKKLPFYVRHSTGAHMERKVALYCDLGMDLKQATVTYAVLHPVRTFVGSLFGW